MENRLRLLPSVDKLLSHPAIRGLEGLLARELLTDLVRENLAQVRAEAGAGKETPELATLVDSIRRQARALARPGPQPLINATGVVLHTNLGRAPLSEEAIAAMEAASRGYNNLEFSLESGERGSRHSHIEPLVCRLSGAEAALVVNNNAAAVLLGLTVLAKKKEVIVSRGQAVEIGGGFRIPEVMRQSGARLVEVGTTNCTYIRDYEQAINPRTAALLRVHSSNFKVVGFTQMVTLEEMVSLGKKYQLPVLDDLGSGCPLDTTRFGLAAEPTIQESIGAGVDLAFFSGDKLLGGPQAGIIAGRKVHIDLLKKHPLVRALRPDKTRLAGLAATLLHYLRNEAPAKVPVWQMISRPLDELRQRAQKWNEALEGRAGIKQGESLIGGGSLPGATLPTFLLVLGDARHPARAQEMAARLRSYDPPVIGRISNHVLLLDPRTVNPAQDEVLIGALKQVSL